MFDTLTPPFRKSPVWVQSARLPSAFQYAENLDFRAFKLGRGSNIVLFVPRGDFLPLTCCSDQIMLRHGMALILLGRCSDLLPLGVGGDLLLLYRCS